MDGCTFGVTFKKGEALTTNQSAMPNVGANKVVIASVAHGSLAEALGVQVSKSDELRLSPPFVV